MRRDGQSYKAGATREYVFQGLRVEIVLKQVATGLP